MSDYKLLIFSIFFSILAHFIIIFKFTLDKKENEIYVVNLSEYKELSIIKPTEQKEKTEKKDEPLQKKKVIPKEIQKQKIKKIENKDLNQNTISLKKPDKEEPRKIEKVEEIIDEKILPKEVIKKKESSRKVTETIQTKSNERSVTKRFSLENKAIIVDKLLSEYLTFISYEINKVASKSYPIQSIKRREQGKIVSLLTLDKNGNLLDIKFENKSPKRLYNATIKILKNFKYPSPPEQILDKEGKLKIKIPVNFILK